MLVRNKVTIIAECGVNHNGSLALAKEMIDVAFESEADYVKFQTFKVDSLVKKESPMASYQIKNLKESKSQYEMLKEYELQEKDFIELYEYSKKRGIKFLSTPFDFESLHFLISLGLDIIKISSGDLTNAPLLFTAAKNQMKLILSTGMANLEEVKTALSVLQWGYKRAGERPISLNQISEYSKSLPYTELYEKVVLLHCLSDYPAASEFINLSAMATLEKCFSLKVGYSDHSLGTHISVAAVAMGASVIEKHFTLDRNLPGPDHQASLTPDDLKNMVREIRDVELAIGDGIKEPRGSEKETSMIVRKSLYAKDFIQKGKKIRDEDVVCMRPSSSNSPTEYWDIIGSIAKKDYMPGDSL